MAKRATGRSWQKSIERSRLTLEQLEARQLMAADLAVQWNSATMDAIRSDPGSANPGDGSRVFAIVHVAMFDALNAITKDYTAFALNDEAPDWASKEAAVSTAARDALVALYPSQTPKFDALWLNSLKQIPDGAAEDAGVAIGHQAAATIMTLRSDDGSKGGSNYQFNDGPGHWQVDPLHPDQVAWGPDWGAVKMFALDSADQFYVPPPPDLDSPEYAAAYNEVKSLGALNSTTRTGDQTQIGIFWGYDRANLGPPTILFNQAVQTIAQAKGNSFEQDVQLFALVNVAMADTGIATWKAKFDYDFWRPITAIREGNTDGNYATQADPNWTPLGAPGANPNTSSDDFTPPFPAYTSGHAGFGAATFRTLANFYGSDKFNFTLKSDELPGVTRHYSSFSQAAEENGISRIYLGVHWSFDNIEGQAIGNKAADDIYSRMFQPRDNSTLVEIQRDGGGFRTLSLPQGTPLNVNFDGAWMKISNARNGELLIVEPSDKIVTLRIDGRNEATDFVRVITASGVKLPQDLTIEVIGNDEWFDGAGLQTGADNDLIDLNGDILTQIGSSAAIRLFGISYVDIGTHAGNDTLFVHGDQHGRQIDLAGYRGNDSYFLYSQSAKIYLSDTDGWDNLDFTRSTTGVSVDLLLNQGQQQAVGYNTLYLWGNFEAMYGSQFADRLLGNHYDNYIEGRGGDDYILGRNGNDTLIGNAGNDFIHGNAGNDTLLGLLGNDILLGGLGNDSLDGGDGLDLLLGNDGYDNLYGGAGDDILIGGTTAHDTNEVALRLILAEWTSIRPRATRVANITSGTGGGARTNGNYFLKAGAGGTVYDDYLDDNLSVGGDGAWTIGYAKDWVKN